MLDNVKVDEATGSLRDMVDNCFSSKLNQALELLNSITIKNILDAQATGSIDISKLSSILGSSTLITKIVIGEK